MPWLVTQKHLEATCLATGTPDEFAQDREQAEAVREGIHRLGPNWISKRWKRFTCKASR